MSQSVEVVNIIVDERNTGESREGDRGQTNGRTGTRESQREGEEGRKGESEGDRRNKRDEKSMRGKGENEINRGMWQF
jgi:hypothetical protein